MLRRRYHSLAGAPSPALSAHSGDRHVAEAAEDYRLPAEDEPLAGGGAEDGDVGFAVAIVIGGDGMSPRATDYIRACRGLPGV